MAVRHGRYGIGYELKPSYYRSAVRNVEIEEMAVKQPVLFDLSSEAAEAPEPTEAAVA